jgi:hypothetical protein
MYIEEIIKLLSHHTHLMNGGPYRSHNVDMVTSFAKQLGQQRALTEKQRTAAIRIIKSNIHLASDVAGFDVKPYIENPKFKFEVRERVDIRHVEIVQHQYYIQAIQLTTLYNPELIQDLKKVLGVNNLVWDSEMKKWFSPLREENIYKIYNFGVENNFTFSDEFKKFGIECTSYVNNIEDILPVIDVDDDLKPVLRNVSPYMPDLETVDVLSALFEGRKRGITTWSVKMDELLDNYDCHSLTKRFLRSEFFENFDINSTTENISCIKDIVLNLNPCVFIIPGGTELQKLKMIQNFLESINLDSNCVSVLFRLSKHDKDDSSEFNQLVRDLKYNNPLTKDTKIAIISDKIRKPMIESNIKFNSVINLGLISGAHYTLRNFLRSSENIINYSEAAAQRSLHFGNL